MNIDWGMNPELELRIKSALAGLHRESETISREYYERACSVYGKAEARQFLLPRLKRGSKQAGKKKI